MSLEKTNHILILEDDPELRKLLCDSLAVVGRTIGFGSIEEANKHAQLLPTYDLFVLDENLPDGSGLHWCEQKLQFYFSKKIIFVTGSCQSHFLERCLSNKLINDCITKPFNINELVIKTKKHLGALKCHSQHLSSIKSNPIQRYIKSTSRKVYLTPTEFNLWLLFSENYPSYLTRDYIRTCLWQGVHILDRTLDVHICNLRKKLAEISCSLVYEPSNKSYFLHLDNGSIH